MTCFASAAASREILPPLGAITETAHRAIGAMRPLPKRFAITVSISAAARWKILRPLIGVSSVGDEGVGGGSDQKDRFSLDPSHSHSQVFFLNEVFGIGTWGVSSMIAEELPNDFNGGAVDRTLRTAY